MADERKANVSFSFKKKKSSNKNYGVERNALNSEDVHDKKDDKDYIHSAEGKKLNRSVFIDLLFF